MLSVKDTWKLKLFGIFDYILLSWIILKSIMSLRIRSVLKYTNRMEIYFFDGWKNCVQDMLGSSHSRKRFAISESDNEEFRILKWDLIQHLDDLGLQIIGTFISRTGNDGLKVVCKE